ncbi:MULTISPECIES: hypothetical protein [unclassified Roseobacter]|nr:MULTISPECIES: hypothetical protein [unclassified Roseobacter]
MAGEKPEIEAKRKSGVMPNRLRKFCALAIFVTYLMRRSGDLT